MEKAGEGGFVFPGSLPYLIHCTLVGLASIPANLLALPWIRLKKGPRIAVEAGRERAENPAL